MAETGSPKWTPKWHNGSNSSSQGLPHLSPSQVLASCFNQRVAFVLILTVLNFNRCILLWLLLWWSRHLFFKGLFVQLLLLLDGAEEGACIDVDLLAELVIFIFYILKTLLLCQILLFYEILKLSLLLLVDSFLLLVEHWYSLLVCFRIIVRQTFYGFVDISYSFFVLALYLPLLNNLAFILLLNKLVYRLLLLLLKALQLSLAIVEDFLDLWVQILQVLLKFPLHQGSILLRCAILCENLAQFGLVAKFNSEIWVPIHLINETANLCDIIVAFNSGVTGHATLSGWVDHTT